MARKLQLNNGTTITIEDKCFAQGGEGDLYKITHPDHLSNQVVKLYFINKRTVDRQKKLEYLIANPPSLPIQNNHHSVIWPKDIVFDSGKFAGFTMPMVKGKSLERLCHHNLPADLGAEWEKFNFKTQGSTDLRLKLCFNIAVALFHIHNVGNYVLVDMKPDNIMVQSNGLISIIDIDSIQILKGGKLLFPASVATPEYAPPEYYKGLKPENGVTASWDRFCLALIFYRLLCGIHPYTGSCISPFDKAHSLNDMVENGLFPNGKNKSFFKVIPPPHNNFEKLKKHLQTLFIHCFDAGHINPGHRPSAQQWCSALSPIEMVPVNRPLPTSFVNRPDRIIAKQVDFQPHISISLPDIEYLDLQDPKGFTVFVIYLLGKSKRQKVEASIKEQELIVQQLAKKKEFFESELQQVVKSFSRNQNEILNQQRMTLEQVREWFNSSLLNLDKRSNEIQLQEGQELGALCFNEKTVISEMDNEIKQLYANKVEFGATQYKEQISILENKVKELQKVFRTNYDNAIANPAKLSKYVIAHHSMEIFGFDHSKFIQSLKYCGIVTAADFCDVNAKGNIETRDNKLVMMGDSDHTYTQDLNTWRQNVEKIEDQKIKHAFVNRYNSELEKIKNEKNKVELSYRIDMILSKEDYEREKAIIDDNRKKFIQKSESDRNNVKIKYDKFHEDLKDKVNELVDKAIEKMQEINQPTEADLAKNLEKHKDLFDWKWKQANDFTKLLNTEVNKLNELHMQLKKMTILKPTVQNGFNQRPTA